MPLVLLLTGTVSVTSQSHSSSADLLVDGLLKVVVVDDGADLSVAVGRPVRRRHLRPRLARVHAVPLLLVHAGESRLPLLSGIETKSGDFMLEFSHRPIWASLWLSCSCLLLQNKLNKIWNV